MDIQYSTVILIRKRSDFEIQFYLIVLSITLSEKASCRNPCQESGLRTPSTQTRVKKYKLSLKNNRIGVDRTRL